MAEPRYPRASDATGTGRRQGVVAYADGPGTPAVTPSAVAASVGLAGVDVLVGWMPDTAPWLHDPDLRGRTVLGGYQLADAVADGRLAYVPVPLSAMPRWLADVVQPDVVVVSGVRRGRGVAFARAVGWAPAAIRCAGRVVVEVPDGVVDVGAPHVPGEIVACIDGPAAPPTPVPASPSAADAAIARHVLALLPDDPTIQFGPGTVADAILSAIDRPVAIRSGLATDAVAVLAARGHLLGTAVAGYAWGGDALTDLLRAGRVRLAPVEETHDVGALAATPRFVGLNTALQVALDGSVNVERVGGRLVAGIGGHADFCAAASRSRGGLSIVALRSTQRGRSTIVPAVDVVSTPRSDVDVVVTEHGVADLRGVDDAERANRIVAIAAPEHRAGLTEAMDRTPGGVT